MSELVLEDEAALTAVIQPLEIHRHGDYPVEDSQRQRAGDLGGTDDANRSDVLGFDGRS